MLEIEHCRSHNCGILVFFICFSLCLYRIFLILDFVLFFFGKTKKRSSWFCSCIVQIVIYWYWSQYSFWNYPYLQCYVYDSCQKDFTCCAYGLKLGENAVKEDSLTLLWHFRKTIQIARQPWGLLRICGILTVSFLSIGFNRERILRNLNRRQTFFYLLSVLFLNGLLISVLQFILMVVFAYLFFILLVMILAVMSLQASAGPLFILYVKLICVCSFLFA